LTEENVQLIEEVETTKKQRNRTRWIAVGTSSFGILSTIILFVK
jgi:hypothetical protein